MTSGKETGGAVGGGAKLAVVAVGIAAVALAGYLAWRSGNGPAEVPAANLATLPATEPAAAPAAPVAAPAEAEAPAVLTIENWRVESDGAGLVSGRAVARALISVLVDGAPVAEAKAMGSGDYVILFTLPPNDQPSLMTLNAVLEDGTALPSPDAIALAPIPGPKAAVVAEAAPADAPAEVAAAETPPASLLVTDEGVKVVAAEPAPASPGAEIAVTIAAIAYTPAGEVQLSGSGAPGQTVRLYLDDALRMQTPVGADGGWSVVMTDIAPGIYRLRADQIDATGKVTARFETPFKRETPEALAALSEPPAEVPAEPIAAAAAEPAPAEAPAEPAATVAPAPEPAPQAPAEPAAPAAPEATPVEPAQTAEPAAPEPAPAAEAAAAPSAPAAEPAATEPAPQPDAAPLAEAEAPEPAAPASPQPQPGVPGAAAPAPSATASAVPAAPAPEAQPDKVAQTVSITVQPGYSLWKIARDTYGDGILYVQVFEANKDKIGDPDLIYPGQVFELPQQ